MTTLNLSWDTVKDGITVLAHMIAPTKPTLIVGISRGGLIPATLLSHRLNVPMETISASAYEGTRRTLQKPIEIRGWHQSYVRSDVCIIDDILDSGDTLRALYDKADNLAKFTYACLVNKQCTRFPNQKTYFAQVPNDIWVNFPWENEYDSSI